MLVSFEELGKYEFSISGIMALLQQPTYRKMTLNGRVCNGFLYVIEGEMVYSWGKNEVELKPGSVIYLPFGSHHTLRSSSENLKFYRVDFTIKIGEEVVLFSDTPLKITEEASAKCIKAIESLERECRRGNDSLYKVEKVCAIMASLHKEKRVIEGRVASAVEYIHEHLTQKWDCQVLADECFLGIAQFYKLFKEEYGQTPLEYRNDLLMRRALEMLDTGEITVSEVAEMLGFESVAYFSRFFKKHQGISPAEYMKR